MTKSYEAVFSMKKEYETCFVKLYKTSKIWR